MKRPAFQFYYQDFLNGTEEFTAEETGGYIRLLCHQWDKGSLPNDEKRLMRLARVSKKALPALLSKFVLTDAGTLINVRMENDRRKHDEWIRKSAEAGRRSGEARRNHLSTKNEPTFENGMNQKATLQSSSSTSIENTGVAREMLNHFKATFPQYPVDAEKDLPACLKIAYHIADKKNWRRASVVDEKKTETVTMWSGILQFVKQDTWFSTRSISDLNKEWQRLIMSYKKWIDDQNKPKV